MGRKFLISSVKEDRICSPAETVEGGAGGRQEDIKSFRAASPRLLVSFAASWALPISAQPQGLW